MFDARFSRKNKMAFSEGGHCLYLKFYHSECWNFSAPYQASYARRVSVPGGIVVGCSGSTPVQPPFANVNVQSAQNNFSATMARQQQILKQQVTLLCFFLQKARDDAFQESMLSCILLHSFCERNDSRMGWKYKDLRVPLVAPQISFETGLPLQHPPISSPLNFFNLQRAGTIFMLHSLSSKKTRKNQIHADLEERGGNIWKWLVTFLKLMREKVCRDQFSRRSSGRIVETLEDLARGAELCG